MIDVAIIGAGPAGLSAAVNACQMGKSVKIIDSGTTYLSRAEKVNNYLGMYNISGEEMIESFKSHAKNMGADIIPGKVLKILPNEGTFLLNVDTDVYESRAVILALGVCNKSSIKGEQEFLGQGVSYCAVCDGMLYRGKKVAAYGLSNHAEEEANYLANIGVNVVFISSKEKNEKLDKNIEHIRANVLEINGGSGADPNKIITIQDIPNKTIKKLELSAIFILRDSLSPGTLIDGINMVDGYIRVDKNMETNIKNIYAAGDCTGKPLQVAKAVGEGLIAAQVACNRLT